MAQAFRALVPLAIAVLAACGDAGDDRGRSPASGRSAPSGAGRVLQFEGCEGAFIPQRRFFPAHWRRRSLAVGPVRFFNLRAMTRPGLARRTRHQVLKIPALIRPSRELTVEIGARTALAFVRPGAGYAGSTPPVTYTAIRVQDCPSIPRADRDPRAGNRYAFPFFVVVRRDACVPLAVTRDRRERHREVASLGAGDDCATTPAAQPPP